MFRIFIEKRYLFLLTTQNYKFCNWYSQNQRGLPRKLYSRRRRLHKEFSGELSNIFLVEICHGMYIRKSIQEGVTKPVFPGSAAPQMHCARGKRFPKISYFCV